MVWVDLHSAAASADLARLRQHWWLNKHRINAYNRDKQTPLHLACINGHADVVQFLVKKKCKLNPCDKLNKTPLMKAVEHQHGDCAAILLEHGANHAHRGASGNTALHLAVMVSSKSLVELLLEHGADIDAKNELGYTPLTLAITENCEEMVKFLLQKGADVNAVDNVSRTPLTVAAVFGNKKVIQHLLHHGAVFPESDKGYYPRQAFTKVVQKYVFSIANERIDSSCSETASVIPLETPSLAESCDVPKEEAAEKEDSGPAADRNKVSLCSIAVQPDRGNYKGKGGKKKADKRSLCNPETGPKSEGKMWASAWFPAANSNRLDACSAAVERGKGAFPAAAAREAKKEDGDSSWDSEPFSEIVEEVFAGVRHPAVDRKGVGVRSAAAERSKGAFPAAAAREAKKEDGDSSWDSELHSEVLDEAATTGVLPADACRMWQELSVAKKRGKEEVFAGMRRPAVDRKGVGVRSAAAERSKGAFPAAAAREAKKEDGDSSWDSEPFSEIVEEVFAGVRHPAVDRKGVGVRSAAAERSKGALQPAGGAGEDDDSPWDSETDSEGEGKVLAAVQLPVADCNRLDARSAAVEHRKGVLKQTRTEEKKEHGVLQLSWEEVKQEENDFPWDSETDSEGRRKVLASVQLPAADRKKVGVSSAAVERGKAARAEQKEHFISSSENKLATLQGEDLQLKLDSSTLTDSEQDEQPLARQKLDKICKKNSLEGAPLGTVKTNRRKEQKLLLEKLERCKTRLKELKEPLNKNNYDAESGKNAPKEKKVIAILRNLQGRLVDSFDSSAATIPQLEERIQRLRIQMARLEATIQEQANTIEVFETIHQISCLRLFHGQRTLAL